LWSKSIRKILISTVSQLVNELQQIGIIDKWFFLRYTDPENHIRLRLHSSDPKSSNLIQQYVYKYLETYDIDKDSIIWKVQTDTYVRELERYGVDTIEFVENIFYADSQLMLEFVSLFEDILDRYLCAFIVIDEILTLFNYQNKFLFVDNIKQNYYREFRIDKPQKIVLDKIFRENRKQITDTLSLITDKSKLIKDKVQCYKLQEKAFISIIAFCKQDKDLLNSIVSSIIHMSINRLFSQNQRKIELEIYDIMSRYYKMLDYLK